MNEIVKINPADYGLQEQKAQEISAMFKPMLDKMVALETEYNEIAKLEINPITCQKAKDLRLQYVKVRTGTAQIHKELKQFYLLGGRFVDGWKNAQLMASQGIEDKLKDIENHYAKIEQEKIDKIRIERESKLLEFGVEDPPKDLGKMDQSIWDSFLKGSEANYKLLKEAEEREERERIEKDRLDRLENNRQLDASEYKRFWRDDYNFREMKEDEFTNLMTTFSQQQKEECEKQENLRKENERLEKERIETEKKIQAEAEKLRLENEKRLEAERKEREELERQIREQKAKEEKARIEAEALKQAELTKGDKPKMADLIQDLEILKTKYSFQAEDYKRKYINVIDSINSIIGGLK